MRESGSGTKKMGKVYLLRMEKPGFSFIK